MLPDLNKKMKLSYNGLDKLHSATPLPDLKKMMMMMMITLQAL